MFNDYDFMMNLTSIGPIGFLLSAAIVVGLGWLVSKK
jgi:hypothetical protein